MTDFETLGTVISWLLRSVGEAAMKASVEQAAKDAYEALKDVVRRYVGLEPNAADVGEKIDELPPAQKKYLSDLATKFLEDLAQQKNAVPASIRVDLEGAERWLRKVDKGAAIRNSIDLGFQLSRIELIKGVAIPNAAVVESEILRTIADALPPHIFGEDGAIESLSGQKIMEISLKHLANFDCTMYAATLFGIAGQRVSMARVQPDTSSMFLELAKGMMNEMDSSIFDDAYDDLFTDLTKLNQFTVAAMTGLFRGHLRDHLDRGTAAERAET